MVHLVLVSLQTILSGVVSKQHAHISSFTPGPNYIYGRSARFTNHRISVLNSTDKHV